MKSKLLLLASLLFVVCVSSCSDDDDYETYYNGEYGKITPSLNFDTTLVGGQERIVIDTILVDTTNGVSSSSLFFHYICYHKQLKNKAGEYTVYASYYTHDTYGQISWADSFKQWTFQVHKLYYNKETNKVNGFTYTIKERKN